LEFEGGLRTRTAVETRIGEVEVTACTSVKK
jgi:hypothetical protein